MRDLGANRAWLRLGVSAIAIIVAAAAASAAAAQTGASQPAASAPASQQVDAPADSPAASDQPGKTAQASEVVVTGFRNSLTQAINLKRENTAQIDTILAEDIGKFPDLNLAESLQRIPGVSITREGGEGRQVTIRGLGPQYTRTTINGMEALSTIGAPDNDGGVNRTRAFDFTVFASISSTG